MRILQIGMSFNHGGVESFVMNYYRALRCRGVQFDFICMYDRIACQAEIEGYGGEIYFVPNVKQHMHAFQRNLEDIIRKGNYDVIYVNMLSAANILPLKVAHRMGCKRIIAHSHNNATPGIHRKILHAIHKSQVAKYATDIMACSKSAAQFMFGRKLAENAVIINNGIDVERFLFSQQKREAIQREINTSDKNIVIGHVGRFQYQKNQTFLVDVFYELQKKRPDARLVFVGDGPDKSNVIDKVQFLGIGDKVLFLGERQDVELVLAAMDVMVFPSRFEGLGMVVIEAQCAGLPVVCADTLLDETKVMNQYVKVALSEKPEVWANHILELYNGPRSEKNNNLIREKMSQRGYDIMVESEKLWQRLKTP